jgi:5-methylcytosine-specific restriction enzyme subunit McrC
VQSVTLFEHDRLSYQALGLPVDHPRLEQLQRFNAAAGVEYITLERQGIRAHQYVGVIDLGDWAIQILPKIDYQSATPFQRETSAARNLLHMLAYTHGITPRQQPVAGLARQSSNWFELLTRLFAANLHQLLQQGLERSYVPVEDELPVMRGKWRLFDQLRRRPYVRHRFHVLYDEFSPDTPLNRVLRFVASRLLPVTRDALNRRLLHDITRWLHEATALPAVEAHHLAAVHFSRLNQHYQPVFNLARLFIEGQAPLMVAGERQTFGLLFDMNRLFEAFTGHFLIAHQGRILPPDRREGARITLQATAKHLARRQPDKRPAFNLRPDILLTSEARPLLVADTKYKRLSSQERPAGVAESDAYQMLAYATAFQASRTLLIYPEAEGGPRRTRYDIQHSPVRVQAATVNLHRPLDKPDGLIQELRTIMQDVLEETAHAPLPRT